MVKPRIEWDLVASDIEADPAATLALDKCAWVRLGARFRPVDDGDGESPGLATASVGTRVGTVRIGIIDYGEPSTFLLVPGNDPERADSIDAVVETLLASGVLQAEEQVLSRAGDVAGREVVHRVAELERRLATVEAQLGASERAQDDLGPAAASDAPAVHVLHADEFAPLPVAYASDARGVAYLTSSDALKQHDGGPVLAIAFTGLGDVIAIAERSGTIRLWDHSTEAEDRILEGHRGAALSVAFSAHEALLASGGADGTVRLWDVRDGSHRTLSGHRGFVGGVAFSPDGYAIASCGDDGTVRLWSAPEGRPQAKLAHDGDYVLTVAFSPTGDAVASGSYGGRLRLWNRITGVQDHDLKTRRKSVEAIAFSPEGWHVASAGGDATVCVWEVASGLRHKVLHGHRGAVTAVAFSVDGTRLASGGYDGAVRVWDPRSGALLGVLQAHAGTVWAVAYSPDGSTLASAGEDGAVRLWGGGDTRTDTPGAFALGPGQPRPSGTQDR